MQQIGLCNGDRITRTDMRMGAARNPVLYILSHTVYYIHISRSTQHREDSWLAT